MTSSTPRPTFPRYGGFAEVHRIAALLRKETVGGILLVIAALAAVVWANSPAAWGPAVNSSVMTRGSPTWPPRSACRRWCSGGPPIRPCGVRAGKTFSSCRTTPDCPDSPPTACGKSCGNGFCIRPRREPSTILEHRFLQSPAGTPALPAWDRRPPRRRHVARRQWGLRCSQHLPTQVYGCLSMDRRPPRRRCGRTDCTVVPHDPNSVKPPPTS